MNTNRGQRGTWRANSCINGWAASSLATHPKSDLLDVPFNLGLSLLLLFLSPLLSLTSQFPFPCFFPLQILSTIETHSHREQTKHRNNGTYSFIHYLISAIIFSTCFSLSSYLLLPDLFGFEFWTSFPCSLLSGSLFAIFLDILSACFGDCYSACYLQPFWPFPIL